MTTIAAVETRRVSVRLHTPFVTALRRTETVDTLVVTVVDSDGARGYGEAPQVWQVTGESVAGAEACVGEMLAPPMIGAGLDDWEAVLDGVQGRVARNFGAKAAVEAAVSDLQARRVGQPLATWLAGEPVELSLATDVTLSAGDVDALGAVARDRVRDGFAVLKAKVGKDAATDVSRVRAIREAVGPTVGIRLDANQGWSREEAVEVIRALEDADLGVELVEQPVAGDDVEGLAWVRERVGLPIMADESVYVMADLERVVRLGAADLVNVKLAKCGGLRQAGALLRRAREAGLGTCVGSMMETHVGIGAAAGVVAAGAAQGLVTTVPDLDAGWWAVSSPVLGGPVYCRGYLDLPDAPGLAIDGLVDLDGLVERGVSDAPSGA